MTVAVPTQTRPVRNDQFDELDIVVVVHAVTVLPAPQREQPYFLMPRYCRDGPHSRRLTPVSNALLHQALSDGGVAEPWSTRRA